MRLTIEELVRGFNETFPRPFALHHWVFFARRARENGFAVEVSKSSGVDFTEIPHAVRPDKQTGVAALKLLVPWEVRLLDEDVRVRATSAREAAILAWPELWRLAELTGDPDPRDALIVESMPLDGDRAVLKLAWVQAGGEPTWFFAERFAWTSNSRPGFEDNWS